MVEFFDEAPRCLGRRNVAERIPPLSPLTFLNRAREVGPQSFQPTTAQVTAHRSLGTPPSLSPAFPENFKLKTSKLKLTSSPSTPANPASAQTQ